MRGWQHWKIHENEKLLDKKGRYTRKEDQLGRKSKILQRQERQEIQYVARQMEIKKKVSERKRKRMDRDKTGKEKK